MIRRNGGFIARITVEDDAKVYAELCQIVEEWIAIFEKDGHPLPEPLGKKEFSGKVVLRVEPALHRRLAAKALAAALDGCPPAGAGRVWTLLNDRRLQVEVRVLAIRVLGTIRTRATRDWMVEHALTKQGWFRRRRLVPRSMELLAILGCLARSFRQDPNAQLVLQLAQESDDPLIQRAATGAAVEEA